MFIQNNNWKFKNKMVLKERKNKIDFFGHFLQNGSFPFLGYLLHWAYEWVSILLPALFQKETILKPIHI